MCDFYEGLLDEKLERVSRTSIDRLHIQMKQDRELQRMLLTPMEDISQYYYLYGEPWVGKQSLLNAIKYMLNYEHRENLYFSKSGYKFTGFVVYEDNGTVIKSIKTASFLDDSNKANPVLAKDLIEFVLDKAEERESIEWYVDSKNLNAIRQYNAILNKKKLKWKFYKEGRMIKYVVSGYK